MRILLIEDEVQLSDALVAVFKKQHYSTDAVYNGDEGYEYARTGIYDVILLDVMLPGTDGFTVLKKLRAQKVKTPVIMMTALGETEDRIKGLDYGADDYIPKPFDTNELLARIRAVARRKDNDLVDEYTLKFGDLSLDLKAYTLTSGSDSLKVSVKEYEILKYLMEHPQFIATRDDMITKIWGFDNELESNNIEVYISFIRKKLAHIKSNVTVVTVRGVGYKLEDKCSKT